MHHCSLYFGLNNKQQQQRRSEGEEKQLPISICDILVVVTVTQYWLFIYYLLINQDSLNNQLDKGEFMGYGIIII